MTENSQWHFKIGKIIFDAIALASSDLVFMEIGGKPHESPFLLLSGSEKRIEKSCFYQELWTFENGIHIFSFCTRNFANYIATNSCFFQKLSQCTATVPNVMFYHIPILMYGLQAKMTPHKHTQIIKGQA